MSDLISRQQVIQMLNTLDRYVANSLRLCDTDKTFPQNEVFIVDDMYESLEQLPSTEPQKWTPCSQKMPDKDGWYLCSYESRLVQTCLFYCGEWWNNNADINRILAWMPLPSPYILGE